MTSWLTYGSVDSPFVNVSRIRTPFVGSPPRRGALVSSSNTSRISIESSSPTGIVSRAHRMNNARGTRF